MQSLTSMCLHLVYVYVSVGVSVCSDYMCVYVCPCPCVWVHGSNEVHWSLLFEGARSTRGVQVDWQGSGKASQISLCVCWALTGIGLQQAEIEKEGSGKKEKKICEKRQRAEIVQGMSHG